jgi:hypothetical protein
MLGLKGWCFPQDNGDKGNLVGFFCEMSREE